MLAVEAATVGREADGLRFEEVEWGPDARFWSVGVRLRVPGLDARGRVSAHYEYGFVDLVGFFNELAADWRGWRGERTYESLEHDLQLTATHDGHIQLMVQLRGGPLGVPHGWAAIHGWTAVGVVQLDPGEEMTRAAGDVAAFLSPPEG